ncbi:VWA domain-containing protein [Bordetella genomosp. 11]|uniref:VWA domain-containing protein n=1 Tax=Bordetella genomosp. 11 TaxID=1416808 RepID=UPI000B9E90A8|nr:VWA domain-containing protein [Bordetella genomosp. 11]
MSAAMNALPSISFLWPRMLWLLVFVPILVLLYVWHGRRRARAAVPYPALRATAFATGKSAGWRRHFPAVLMLLAVTSLLIAVARPQALVMLPSRLQTLILAMDASGSMRAEDIKPNRMQAARQAARILIDAQPADVSVAVVSVAGTAALAQAPSRRKEDVVAALDRLQPQRGTALGNGLIIALVTLLPKAGIDVDRFMNDSAREENARPAQRPEASRNGARGGSDNGAALRPLPREGDGAKPAPDNVGAIVLLSDGENNTGPEAIQAAQVAAEHGVRIYTVGIGTPDGVVITVDGWSSRVRLDEAVLKKVADITGGEYFRAEDAEALKKVYGTLSARLAFDRQDLVEITALFAALGALLAACAGLVSLWWFGRVL